ncbi:uncharacterized protein B0H18DRAFT_194554 [Fomitopsis serialis]|uniref:uncharacterized protein n=1 Tax=Fomitopsis serialis TaxID=139415 RepID=UPI0020085A71|nr:uncharacterized protein B0H18DRAFT_194554 [Neoantrodia serialis]KAH9937345.1 hypothetical protein B0H18DRAFT_194554 [Neoantrodia serialis]
MYEGSLPGKHRASQRPVRIHVVLLSPLFLLLPLRGLRDELLRVLVVFVVELVAVTATLVTAGWRVLGVVSSQSDRGLVNCVLQGLPQEFLTAYLDVPSDPPAFAIVVLEGPLATALHGTQAIVQAPVAGTLIAYVVVVEFETGCLPFFARLSGPNARRSSAVLSAHARSWAMM